MLLAFVIVLALLALAALQIWNTRNYQDFTQRAFGGFLHHTPAVVLSSQSRSNVGLRRCWRHVCLEENINPRKPTRLPLLFALDAKLGIANGFHYIPDCSGVRRDDDGGSTGVHCGGDFADPGIDGGTDGLTDGGNDGHHGGGDGHGSGDGSSSDGDGGGGCGGGCGGD